MNLLDHQKLFEGKANTPFATAAFTSIAVAPTGRVFIAFRAGTDKDAADGNAYLMHSDDGGDTWSEPVAPFDTTHDGAPGSLRGAYVSHVGDDRLIAVTLWIDRSDPDKPLFSPETEGLLPCRNVLYESHDQGDNWSPLSVVDTSNWEGLPSLCAPVIRADDSTLAVFLERNKTYDDPRPWHAQAVVKFSRDGGRTWPDHAVVASHPQGKRYCWDQRTCVMPDGRILNLFWTFDRELGRDVTIHRAESNNGGRDWTEPMDMQITGQIAWPLGLPDGRLFIAYIDRYHTRTIRCRTSADDDMAIYTHATDQAASAEMGDYLQDMQLWTFGHPSCALLPSGDVAVVHYAGNGDTLDVCFARVRL